MIKKIYSTAPTVQLTRASSGTYIHDIFMGNLLKVPREIADILIFFQKGASVSQAKEKFPDLADQIPGVVKKLKDQGFIVSSRAPVDTSKAFSLQADFFQPPTDIIDPDAVHDLPPVLTAKDLLNAAYGLYGIAKAQMIQTALELDLFTILDRTPSDLKRLSRQLKIKQDILRAFVEALLELGLVRKNENVYGNTALATACLVKSSPHYLCALDFGQASFKAWQVLTAAVIAGRSPKDFVKRVWGGKSSASVNRAMSSISYNVIGAFVKKIDLSSTKRMLDLGGGVGVWSMELTKRFRNLRMVIFDQPEVIKTALVQIGSSPAKDRIKTIQGNFFTGSFGRGYDAILMVNVIHCNREQDNRALFQKAYRALAAGGRIIIVNQLQDEKTGGNAEFSLFTFLMYNTFLYSPAAVGQWLLDAKFTRVQTIPLKPSKFTAVVGYK